MPKSPLYRSTAAAARKHSRVSLIAASVTTVGVLGAVGFAAGSAPWTQTLDSAATTMANGSQLTASGQHADLFKALTGSTAGSTAGKTAAAAQFDTVRSAATGGSAAAPAASHQPAQHQDAAVAVKQQPAKEQPAKQAAKEQPAKQAAKEQPAKQAAKEQPAKLAAKAAPAKPKAADKPKAAPKLEKPYLIYDSVTPSSIPAGKAAAVYVNGSYAASASQTAGHSKVLWIDTNGSNPSADVLDVEPGDATPHRAAVWVQQRLSQHPKEIAIVYTMRSLWQEVKDNVAHLPAWQQNKVRYWIADPTGVPHVVPGSHATQWYWGDHYDITTANPGFTH
jgi:hypothetical protein